MSLEDWYQKAHRLNTMAPRHCPCRPPCSQRTDAAVYEYVTSQAGRALVLRCLNCGALKHIAIGTHENVFESVWTPGDPLPIPDRVVHLPGELGSRERKRAMRRRK